VALCMRALPPAARPRARCGTTSCAAPPDDSSDSIVGALLCYGVGLSYRSGQVAVSRAGRRVEGRGNHNFLKKID